MQEVEEEGGEEEEEVENVEEQEHIHSFSTDIARGKCTAI